MAKLGDAKATFVITQILTGAGRSERNIPAFLLDSVAYDAFLNHTNVSSSALGRMFPGPATTVQPDEPYEVTNELQAQDFINAAISGNLRAIISKIYVGSSSDYYDVTIENDENSFKFFNYCNSLFYTAPYTTPNAFNTIPSDYRNSLASIVNYMSTVALPKNRFEQSVYEEREGADYNITPLYANNVFRGAMLMYGRNKMIYEGFYDRPFVCVGVRNWNYVTSPIISVYDTIPDNIVVSSKALCFVFDREEVGDDGSLNNISSFIRIGGDPNSYATYIGTLDAYDLHNRVALNQFIYRIRPNSEELANFKSSNIYVWQFNTDPLESAGYSSGNDTGLPGVQPDGANVGGDGTFELQSNDVPESVLPPISSSLVGSGCGTVYCDVGTNVRSLMSYMWTHADDIIANLKKIIANPIDSILGLHIVPVVPSIGTSTQVYLGNVGTGVNMTPVTNPYLRYRLGSLVINKYWGSALDFSPFTQFNIHLPYIGFRQLNTDDLMGSVLELYYDIDVISGACVAHLKVTRTDPLTKETHTVDQYSWAGNCAMQVPVTSTNYQGLYSAILNSVVAVASGIAGAAVGGLISAGGEVAGKTLATGIAHSATTTANNLFNGGSKIRVGKSGNVSGVHGFLDSQYAYIERITPRQSLANNYRQVLGYPSNTTQVLGTCTGFTQIEDINLENFSCTADEKNELERLLKGGVIF